MYKRERSMLKDEEALTVQRVRELLDYHPEKGLFTWRVKHGRNSDIGKRAGSKRGKYWQIYIDKKSYAEHRLAWLYVNGSWPTARYIDHINGDSRDNRIENLRECTNGQNMQNQRVAHRNSKTGFLGVQALGDGRYGAQITKDRTTQLRSSCTSLECYRLSLWICLRSVKKDSARPGFLASRSILATTGIERSSMMVD
jgi:hypothetical protein